MKNHKTNNSGFSLLEAVIVIFVFAVISYGILILVSSMLSDSSKQEMLLSDADQARRVSIQIMQELRNAQNSNTGSYPIALAGDQQLILYYNLDGGVEVERIRYFIQNGELMKGILKPSGNPLSYNPANETVGRIQTNVANQANPLFYYYDGTYTGVTDSFLPQPVNVTDVKYVKMNLQVINKGGRSDTGTFTITAAATVRNLKTNLGE